jgi:uncharacterized protein (UPF0548 family)
MLVALRPNDARIERFLSDIQGLSLSYPEAGATLERPPSGYKVDHNRAKLGLGRSTFLRAMEAIKTWRMFDVGWIRLLSNDAPVETGSSVGLLVRHYGFWSLNACRIVYAIDENSPIPRFGFAYGTLTEHAERGEERFTVEWRADDDTVWYDILAFSKPNYLSVRIGYPLARVLQKRFAMDSIRAMSRAVSL